MRKLTSLLAVAALTIAVTACGSDDESGTATTPAGTEAPAAPGATTADGTAVGGTAAPGGDTGGGDPAADAAAAGERVADALKPITDIGVDVPLTETPPTDVTVAWIGGGLQSTQAITPGYKAATEALGWDLVIIDYDQADPQSVNSAVQQAVDQDVDYVAISGTPIASFEQAAAAAQAKEIPIIDMYSTNEATGKDGNGIYAVISDADSTRTLAAQLVDFAISDSGGTAHTVFVNLPEFEILQIGAEAASTAYADNCGECTFDELDVTLADLAGGAVPSLVVSYLQSHPDVNYVSYAIGDLFGGVPEALGTAGLADQAQQIGGVPNLDQIQTLIDGESSAWAVLPREESAWHAVDAMARISIGQDLDAVTPVLLTPLWTPDNVPKPAMEYTGAEGYADSFSKLWGV